MVKISMVKGLRYPTSERSQEEWRLKRKRKTAVGSNIPVTVKRKRRRERLSPLRLIRESCAHDSGSIIAGAGAC